MHLFKCHISNWSLLDCNKKTIYQGWNQLLICFRQKVKWSAIRSYFCFLTYPLSDFKMRRLSVFLICASKDHEYIFFIWSVFAALIFMEPRCITHRSTHPLDFQQGFLLIIYRNKRYKWVDKCIAFVETRYPRRIIWIFVFG